MSKATHSAATVTVRRRPRVRRAPTSNVVQLHQRVLPRHAELLGRWLAAGRAMGLCDAAIVPSDRAQAAAIPPAPEYVLIWVRENIDPAYMIRPERLGWTVVDAVRERDLGRTKTLAAALHMIRPVLPLDHDLFDPARPD